MFQKIPLGFITLLTFLFFTLNFVELKNCPIKNRLIWPCYCDQQNPTEFQCKGAVVNDLSFMLLRNKLRKLSKWHQHSLQHFNQLRLVNTWLTQINTDIFHYFPSIKDVLFDSNQFLTEIHLHSFYNANFSNFVIKNMNVDIEK